MKSRMYDSTKLNFIKLLKLFEDSVEDVVAITRAFSIAYVIHREKFYDNIRSEPYINHTLRVALILASELKIKDKDVIIAAILHDAFEKTYANPFEADLLKKIIGDKALNLIFSTTKFNIKNMESNEYCKLVLKSSKFVRYLILANRLDSIRILKGSIHKDKIQRFKKETQEYFLPIANLTDDNLVFKLSVAMYELK
ncbi:MAG TPA: HD domain-containing protein [Nitrososphaeraceae archaeon]